ncbi:unnamed protein product [Acanthoscelides obtectus]|nr:unnamed protein product [Acanthoscelides obtectus]CAK1668199.1 Arf-GAP with Rho-GAP domain, ANK repeat and PH domain-containing protein 2 [Acanthoscelides obtectus]
MDNALPAPKKPVPTPRRSVQTSPVIPKPVEPVTVQDESSNTNTNTLTKRVSTASKQLAEDIGNLVSDRKRAVIEGTRQSVRKLTRKFSSASREDNNNLAESPPKNDEDTINIFSTIRFNSPMKNGESLYSNVDGEETETDYSSGSDIVGLPPPNHPPPPPPDESYYDAPLSSASASSTLSTKESSPEKSKPEPYESIFPLMLKKDSGSSSDQNESLSRSGSWKFYDTVTKSSNEEVNIYNIEEKAEEEEESIYANSSVEQNSCSTDSGSSKGGLRRSYYENHDIVVPKMPAPRPSKSVIMQFDPLQKPQDSSLPPNDSHIKMLEEMLQGDLYGTISDVRILEEWSLSDSQSESDAEFISPPTPPLRSDSLPEENAEDCEAVAPREPTTPEAKSRTNWFTVETESKQTAATENKKQSWLKRHISFKFQVKDVLDKAPEVVKSLRSKDSSIVERPAIGGKHLVQKKGMLYKVQSGPVEDLFGEYSGRWCIIEHAKFLCYSDNTCQHLREHFTAQNILSIQLLQDKKYNYRYDNDDLYCFELNVTGKSRGGHVYGSRNISERRVWMQLLVESLTNRFATKITTNFTRMGWAYVREGVSSKWVGAWVILSEREVYYAIDNQQVKVIDLRKARCIILQPYQETDNNPKTNDKGPNMLIDCPDLVLYLRMWTSRETKVWCHIIKLEAHNNGANLEQQQLTKNDVPVIVEKCVNFIYAHGSMTEGIYRRPGTGSVISELLAKFRKDAFAVQLTNDQYTEHEVATALKRFFRDLPEPLLGSNQRQYFYEVSKHNNREERIRMYRAALDMLHKVSYNTARKVFGHLHFISTQSERNKMTIENLAAIWGPTLLHYEDKDPIPNVNHSHQLDTEVVSQIISLYRYIFPEDPGEIEKERMMLQVLESHSISMQGKVAKKTAGDLRIWIFLHNKDGKSFNVSIEPTKTAYEVCKELCCHLKLGVHETILEEVILNDKLIRPIHHEEKVLDVVLKWSYWEEQDRKDNYLTIAPLSKYWEYISDSSRLFSPVSGELKFADNRSRLFRQYTFQFSQGKITCFKDKS